MHGDLRHALRSLGRDPVFTLAVVATLGLGIGANVAVFSLVHGVLLEPLPYQHGERLVVLEASTPAAGDAALPFAIQEVHELRSGVPALDRVVEHHSMYFTLIGRPEPERVSTGVVSADFFDALGVSPLLGRTFRPDDDDLGAEAVLVLSNAYWQRSFGADETIVGQVFEMNNRPHTVVGVLPPLPHFPAEQDVYMPTSACPFRAGAEQRIVQNRSSFRALVAFARLRDNGSLDEARAQLATFAAQTASDFPETYPPERGLAIDAVPLQEALTSGARATLLVLLGVAALVLVLACANVANLSLARLDRRSREMALRASLGAGRARLARLALVESGLLGLVGGTLGVGLAYGSIDLLRGFVGRLTPRAVGVAIDLPVLLFALGVSVLVGVVFGLLPAVVLPRALGQALREGGKTAGSRGGLRARRGLIAVQVALAVVVLLGAGLMLRSLSRLQGVESGFDASQGLSARISLNWSRYQGAANSLRFWDTLLERVRALPAVAEAAAGSTKPLDGQPPFLSSFRVEGLDARPGEAEPQIALRTASEGYFSTLGVPLLQGRPFEPGDDGNATPVAVVNRSLTERFFADRDPLGQRLSTDGGRNWLTVVGVVADVRHRPDAEAEPALYVPLRQAGFGQQLFVRTRTAVPASLERELRQAVYAVDAEQPIDSFETLADTRRAAVASPRLLATLMLLFAGVGLAVTCAGIIGLVAFSVSQRTREIGVRIALGATGRGVLGMVVADALKLCLLGLALGVLLALGLGRFARSLLFEISPNDPLTLGAVAAVVVIAAFGASLLPALRATRLDPTRALRAE
jgi:putative ABC transport system permease protein